MARILTALFLLLAFSPGAQAQMLRIWASARERGLKGKVHTVIMRCSNIDGRYANRHKYEFARDGELMVIEAPQSKYPIVIRDSKVTKRNGRGDPEEVAILFHDEVMEMEKYEIEYDGAGNWVKLVTYLTRMYEDEGRNWPAGEWRAMDVCHRTIEYYPRGAT